MQNKTTLNLASSEYITLVIHIMQKEINHLESWLFNLKMNNILFTVVIKEYLNYIFTLWRTTIKHAKEFCYFTF